MNTSTNEPIPKKAKIDDLKADEPNFKRLEWMIWEVV